MVDGDGDGMDGFGLDWTGLADLSIAENSRGWQTALCKL